MTRAITLAVPLTICSFLGACATPSGPSSAPPPANLAECSSAPHCVSSMAADEAHLVRPFYLKPDGPGWPAVIEAVKSSERTTIVSNAGHYLHAEVLSPWKFYIDDLELMLRNDGRVDVRSSSRIGYYDFEVNRKRVEALRLKLTAAGVLR